MVLHGPQPNRPALQCVASTVYNSITKGLLTSEHDHQCDSCADVISSCREKNFKYLKVVEHNFKTRCLRIMQTSQALK